VADDRDLVVLIGGRRAGVIAMNVQGRLALRYDEGYLASAATDAVNRFVNALAYNWIIGSTDAHAKNYSVLLSGLQVRLASLYDVASTLPYDDMYVRGCAWR
jgi:serine/threonine protein kinase HipA of HipAB toxin-antitoxin module